MTFFRGNKMPRMLVFAVLFLAFNPARAIAAPSSADPATSAGSIGIRLADVAEDLKDDPRANIYITDNVPPGGKVTHHVTVSNNTDSPQTIDVYAGPATLTDGTFAVAERGETNALTSWITVGQANVHLDPGSAVDVPVVIDVPSDAPEVEQYGAVWASLAQTAEGGVTQVSRVGVRVYLSVGEGNGPPADFRIDSLAPTRGTDGSALLVAHVQNTGGRAVDISGTMNLSGGPGGLTAEPVNADYATIAPGAEGKVEFVVPNSASLPAGPWQAQVKLESGFNKHDLSASVTFPDRGVGDAVGASGSGWSIGAWVGLAIGVLVVVLAFAAYVVRKRRGHAGNLSTGSSSQLDR